MMEMMNIVPFFVFIIPSLAISLTDLIKACFLKKTSGAITNNLDSPDHCEGTLAKMQSTPKKDADIDNQLRSLEDVEISIDETEDLDGDDLEDKVAKKLEKQLTEYNSVDRDLKNIQKHTNSTTSGNTQEFSDNSASNKPTPFETDSSIYSRKGSKSQGSKQNIDSSPKASLRPELLPPEELQQILSESNLTQKPTTHDDSMMGKDDMDGSVSNADGNSMNSSESSSKPRKRVKIIKGKPRRIRVVKIIPIPISDN